MIGQLKILAAGLILGLAGCAASGPTAVAEKGREALVKERAQARWDAVVNDRLDVAYGYFSPASRSLFSLTDYIRTVKAGFWKAAQVDGVECQEEELCDALVTIEYEFQGRRVRTPMREAWIRTDGNWWYVKKS
jgi:hypothetical protein